jgi:TusA-related sulfurtransferase
MYKLLKDKNNEFQCEIRLEGAAAKDAKARLFLEADGCEYVFNGTIHAETCTIPLGKLKKYANLLESGKIRLEVVADDTLFVPYESDYQLEQEKRVTVEVKQPDATEKKPIVEVKVAQPQPAKPAVVAQPKVPAPIQKKDPINEIKTYFKNNTAFNGTPQSFKAVIKYEKHKNFFNNICEANKLDRLVALKQILK